MGLLEKMSDLVRRYGYDRVAQVLDEIKLAKKTDVKLPEVGDFAFVLGKEILFAKSPMAYEKCIGVVGYVNPDVNAVAGQRALILALQEQTLLWVNDPDTNNFPHLGATSDSGAYNTNKMMEYYMDTAQDFPAMNYCLTYETHGVKDWFFPSLAEMEKFHHNFWQINSALLKIDGELLKGVYWTSTEEKTRGSFAMKYTVNSGKKSPCSKKFYFFVRPVLAV